jgi:CRISPR/Cas system CSM-associated protein Csm3 (group 7 of RAMP superfamily)
MSRPVATRFKITGTLTAETPIHVGGIDGNPATDLPLSMDGQGQLNAPGMSLAGPLRHWLVERFGRPHVEKFWGRIPQRNDANDGHASYVLVEDSKVRPPTASRADIRDSVGIDRAWGTAAESIKFDREVLPKGATITLCMTLDVPPGGSGPGEIRALLEALMDSEIRLGAAKTRGLGRVRLSGVQVERLDIGTRTGVLALLRGRGVKEDSNNADGNTQGGGELDALGDAAQPTEARAHARIKIKVDWAPLGPVMVKASADGTAVDMMPLVTADGTGGEAPVIPGASAKGALRQRSERILATVLQVPLPPDDPSGQQRLDGTQRLQRIKSPSSPGPAPAAAAPTRSVRSACTPRACWASSTRPPPRPRSFCSTRPAGRWTRMASR